jgi:hypothetical protein
MKTALPCVIGGVLLALVGLVVAPSVGFAALAHRSSCHTQHTCPSDHHTYVWKNPKTGKRWNCAKRTADEYNPARDKTKIVWGGRTYYCRAVGSK